MAIEFRCTQCGKLLRTGDDTAGKQAQCPGCGTIMTIPEGTADAGSPLPPPNGNPFGAAGPQPLMPIDSGNPYQSPREYAPIRPAGFQGAIVPGTLDLGDIFSRTWTLFQADWGVCVGVALIVWLLSFGVNTVSRFVPVIGMIIALLFQTWLNIGQALFFLKKARGQGVEISEIFQGGPYFGKILLASILVGLMVFGIVLVCMLPLILVAAARANEITTISAIVGGCVAVGFIWYVMLRFGLFYYLILDRNVGVIESLRMSTDLMEGNKMTLFLIGLVGGALSMLAVLLTCGLGAFVVMPYFAMMHAVVYLTIIGQPTAEMMQRGPIA